MAFEGRFKSAGGGYLNNTPGSIAALRFEATEWNKGTPKAYSTFSLVVDTLADGATEPVPQFLEAGFLYPKDGQGISEDGLTLESDKEGDLIAKGSNAERFLASLVEAGIPEEEVLAGNLRNFENLFGRRVVFGKEPDVAKQMASGRKALNLKAGSYQAGTRTYTDADIMTAGKRKDKKDKSKSYNHDRLIVTSLLGEAPVAAPAAKTAAAKPATKAATKTATKPATKPAEVDSDALFTQAESMLLTLLANAKDNVLARTSLPSLVVKQSVAENLEPAERDAIRKVIVTDEFLSRQSGWVVNVEDKKGVINLAV